MDIVQAFLDIALLGSAWVLWLLVLLSILSVAIIIERIVYFAKINIDFEDFSQKLTALVIDKKFDEAENICRESPSLEAQATLKALEQRSKGANAMEQTMASFVIGHRQNLDRGLVVLGTLGNNAPFIGLFGTVLGIIEAFNSLAVNTGGGPSVVMAGISEALVATAVGLIVAIPAVIAFNAFSRIVKRRVANAESIMKMLVAQG